MHTWGLSTLGAKCNRWKNGNNIFFPDRGSNPVRWTQSPTLYHVAIKAGLYRKAVQVSYIPIPGDMYIWYENSYWSKILFGTTPTPAYDLNVKVTDLEICVKILR